MDTKILPAENGKHVTKITTPSGAVGFFASDVPVGAVEMMLARALKRQQLMEKMESSNVQNPAIGAGRHTEM